MVAALSSILVARLLGSTAYGFLGIALVPISIIGLFSDLGVGQGMIRFSAQYRAQGREEESRGVLVAGLLLQFLLGSLLAAIALVSSSFLAVSIFQKPDLTPLIRVASLILLFNCVVMACQASFTGFDRMGFYSLTMMLLSVLKILLAPLLVLLGYGALGAITGNMLGLLVTALAATALVEYFLLRPIRVGRGSSKLSKNVKTLLSYGYPLFLSVLLSGSLSQIYSFLMALYCSEYLVGNYLVTTKFSALITFFTMPISTVLFPAFSQLDRNRDRETLKRVFQSSVKYTALVTLPVVCGLIVLSQPIISFLFGEGYEPAALFLMLYAVSQAFVGLGGLSIISLINGQGETRMTMLINVTALLAGVPLSLYLIPRFQIIGLLTCTILANIPGLALGIWWVKKAFGFSLDVKSCAKAYAASLSAALGAYLVIPLLGDGDLKRLVFGGAVFLLLYILLLPLTRAVERRDIVNLRELLSGLGPFSKLFEAFLSLADKVLVSLSGR